MSDLLDIVEAAYDPTGDQASWLNGLARAALPHLAEDWGAAVWLSDAQGNILDYGKAGVPSTDRDPYEQGRDLTSPDFALKACEAARKQGHITSLVELFGTPTAEHDPGHLREVAHPRASQDAVMLLGDTLEGDWLGVCALRREPWKVSKAERRTWGRLAAHLGAGLRLRRQGVQSPTEAAAVATPEGRIEHALPSAQQPAELDALVRAVRGNEKARGSLRREDPGASLELWKALVSGRWSLVDHFDSDGRRYILARENAPNPLGPRQLTPRQRSAVKLRARGHSLKYIAYELGLSVPTISAELREAFRILGVSSGLELAAVFDPLPQSASRPPPPERVRA